MNWFFFIFLFVHTRQDTNVGNHSHVHSTNNHIYIKDGKTLMMVLRLNCKYYKNITYCTATEIYDSQYKYLKLMHNYKLSASNAHLLSNSSVLL